MRLSYKGWFVFSQLTPTYVGRSLWIRSCGDRNCSRRATVRLGMDTLIANILVDLNIALLRELLCTLRSKWQMNMVHNKISESRQQN